MQLSFAGGFMAEVRERKPPDGAARAAVKPPKTRDLFERFEVRDGIFTRKNIDKMNLSLAIAGQKNIIATKETS